MLYIWILLLYVFSCNINEDPFFDCFIVSYSVTMANIQCYLINFFNK